MLLFFFYELKDELFFFFPSQSLLQQETMAKQTSSQGFEPLSTMQRSLTSQEKQSIETMTSGAVSFFLKSNSPDYLTPGNSAFEHMIQGTCSNSTNAITIEELRPIAILIHQRTIIALEVAQWFTCLKSGTGILKEGLRGPQLWPTIVKVTMHNSSKHDISGDPVMTTISDEMCLIFVQEYLHRLEAQQKQYQIELEQLSHAIDGYQITLEPILQSWIQQRLQPLQAEYDYKIALIKYNYEDNRLEHELQQQLAHHQVRREMIALTRMIAQCWFFFRQIQVIQDLFIGKYEQEQSKQELIFTKEQLKRENLLPSFDAIQRVMPSLIHTIQSHSLRQSLSDRQAIVIRQYIEQMKSLWMTIAETQMSHAQQCFDHDMAKFWQDQHTLPFHQRFNPTILNLIDQRFTNITEKVQAIYQYKMAQCCTTT